MLDTVRCPKCHVVLRLPEGMTDATLTCPRCLAVVSQPGTPSPAPSPTAVAEGPPPVMSHGPRCPVCGAEVQSEWRYCPMCNAPRDEVEPEPPRKIRNYERDVGQDRSTTDLLVKVIGVIILVPILGSLFSGQFSLSQGESWLMLLLVLAVVGAIMGPLLQYTGNPTLQKVGRVMEGVTQGFLRVVMVLFLLWMGTIIFFFGVCFLSLGGGGLFFR